MFKVRVDTGGTFTDCRGQESDDASPALVKVLSSGVLRVSVREQLSPNSLKVDFPKSWNLSEGFFCDFQLRADIATSVTGFDFSSSILTTADEVIAGASIDLFTGEEAPVVGARLLTGTALSEEFPLMDFRLATTRGTNALLEGKGAELAFFTTRGFGDLLTIGDQRRSDLFALKHHRPGPLHKNAVEIDERVDAEGKILKPFQPGEELKTEVAGVLAQGVRVAAIALMHSYINPVHEKQLRDFLLEQGFDHVSISSDLAPLIKILPRARTAVTNAYLQPVMQSFLDHVHSSIGTESPLLTMTSAGGLEPIESYTPKDALLSGPAGGVAGAAAIARRLGFEKVLTFDMGGTSTDVARYDGDFIYQFEQKVGDAHLLSPALKIETVASGGGSLCHWKGGGIHVGPESAGADPGPACYGRGGPLTITDVNLLLGRIDPDNFGIPLTEENFKAPREKALALQAEAGVPSKELDPDFLSGLLEISIEQMADAIRTISIRDGEDPADHALLAFGGAGPLHACDIAERLGISEILIPAEAGLLSAFGLDQARVERFSEMQVSRPLLDKAVPTLLKESRLDALKLLEETGYQGRIFRSIAEMRLAGQDATLAIEFKDVEKAGASFYQAFRKTFGYDVPEDREIEIVSIRSIARTETPDEPGALIEIFESTTTPTSIQEGSFLNRTLLNRGNTIAGPGTIQDPFSTLYLKAGWIAEIASDDTLILRHSTGTAMETGSSRPLEVTRELFRHRFDHLVEEMGTMLQRSAISTNVKERADFSCALLNAEGSLITSAPHIPVHLGALGLCVREVMKMVAIEPGDTIITNHPGVGGSHLPDVTLITPVFHDGRTLVGFVANRAHHAEIGGISPGSMPPNAAKLAEEGVVIFPQHLIKAGQSCFDSVEKLLTQSPFPTRKISDNLADLNAQLAANLRGVELLQRLLQDNGAITVLEQLNFLTRQSDNVLLQHLETTGFRSAIAEENLDDGSTIAVKLEVVDHRLIIDFEGTSPNHSGNLNATPAIVQSAILYVLRLWTQSELPLNEGMLVNVEIRLPCCFLNPEFSKDPNLCPAVVGGNVETSQRIVDTLLKALRIQACSQGTMNNLIFGDETFGYYETICGGSGAGDGYDGTSGVHTHMTNTAITDPEILETRYPVRLEQFSIRSKSGGEGKFKGGDGIIRELTFLSNVRVSLLTQHRIEAPYGLEGGGSGKCGAQTLNGGPLSGIAAFQADPGDTLRINTPGGGAWGDGASNYSQET